MHEQDAVQLAPGGEGGGEGGGGLGGGGEGGGEGGGGEGLPWSSYVVADLSAAVCGTVQLAYVWHQLVYSMFSVYSV